MPTKHTLAQRKYDEAHRRNYGFRLHNEIDKDIIQKLASVPSMQGYIKQLIRQDLAGSVPISLSKTSTKILTEKAKKTGIPVPELVAVIVNEQVFRSMQETKERKEQKTMKTYKIKPEYLDMWEGGDSPSNPDRIITEDDVQYFSKEWEKPIEELLCQLEEQ